MWRRFRYELFEMKNKNGDRSQLLRAEKELLAYFTLEMASMFTGRAPFGYEDKHAPSGENHRFDTHTREEIPRPAQHNSSSGALRDSPIAVAVQPNSLAKGKPTANTQSS